jgi:hypothetical protein
MEFRLVNSEEPHLHWESVFVKGKRVLDLGCGDFGRIAGLTYPSTLEYFLGLGAIYVIGVDGSNQDVETMKSNMNDYLDMFSIENTLISNVDTMIKLIEENDIDIIKSDIEGGELHLLSVPDEIFSKIEQYYIETHGDELYKMAIDKLTTCGYEIYDKIDLTHTNGECKVIFARKL